MYYLILDENLNNKIISDDVFTNGTCWSCGILVKQFIVKNKQLYLETNDGNRSLLGNIVKFGKDKFELIAENTKILYRNKWYKVKTLEDRDGLFIIQTKEVRKGVYVEEYYNIQYLDKKEITDVDC